MNFYFCEACGKRVTEVDIAAGRGRNKKLRGVFCTACAQGVNTLETLPLDEDEARRILAQQAKPDLSAPSSSQDRSTPSKGLARPVLPRTGEVRPRVAPAVSSKPSRWPIVAALAGLAALASALGVWILGSRPVLPQAATPREPGSPVAGLPEPRQQVRPSAILPTAKAEPAQAPDRPEVEPLEKPDSSAAAPAPGEEAPATGSPPAPATGTSPAAGKEAPPAAGGVEAVGAAAAPRIPAHELAFSARLLDLLGPLGAGDLSQAAAVARAMAQDAALGEWQGAGRELEAIFDEHQRRLERQAKQRRTVVQGLVGKEVRLETNKGSLKGKVQSAKGEVLWVAREYEINGQTRTGAAEACALEDLTPACRERICGPEEPETAQARLLRVLEELAAGRLEAAEAQLAGFEGHMLQVPLREFIKRQVAAAREAAAREAWERLEAQAAAATEDEQARKLLADLTAFEAAHGASEQAQATATRRAALREEMEAVAMALKKRLGALFKGKLAASSARDRTVALAYDFRDLDSTRRQLEDFTRAAGDPGFDREKLREAGLRFSMGPLALRAFRTEELRVSLAFKPSELHSKGGCFAIWLGVPDSREAATVMVKAGNFTGLKNGEAVGVYVTPVGKWDWPDKKLEAVPVKFLEDAKLEVHSTGGRIEVKLNEERVLECAWPGVPRQAGLGLFSHRAGPIYRLEVSGKLDEAWLNKALEQPAAGNEGGP